MTLTARLSAIATSILFYIRPAASVDNITAALHATLGKLETAQERHGAAAKRDEEKAVVLIRQAIAKRAEAGRARRVASRLSDLLN